MLDLLDQFAAQRIRLLGPVSVNQLDASGGTFSAEHRSRGSARIRRPGGASLTAPEREILVGEILDGPTELPSVQAWDEPSIQAGTD